MTLIPIHQTHTSNVTMLVEDSFTDYEKCKVVESVSTCVAVEKLTYLTIGKLWVSENICRSIMEFLKQNVGNDQ